MVDIDLSGRVAVVTGGAKGLGREMVRRFLSCGAEVEIWDLAAKDLKGAWEALAESDRLTTRQVDVAVEKQVEAAAREALEEHGRVDILVNNAGIGGPNSLLEDIAAEQWQQVFDVNVLGTFLCTRAVLPTMKAAGAGRIVNVASANGKEGNPRTSPYSGAKAAVIALTKSLAKEVANDGILVNCIAPASVNTDFLASRSQAHLESVKARIPLGRFAEPHEVAAMVAWMCSEDLTYTTGACFDLSGGRLTY